MTVYITGLLTLLTTGVPFLTPVSATVQGLAKERAWYEPAGGKDLPSGGLFSGAADPLRSMQAARHVHPPGYC